MKKIILLTGLIAGMLPGLASAAAIGGLYNTGVNDSGVVLTNNSIDIHYTMTGAETVEAQVLTDHPVGTGWIPENTTSAWVIPEGSDDVGLFGEYTYTTTFDLTGFDAATAQIEGRWSTDNGTTDILINGTSLGYTTDSSDYNIWAQFSVTSGFIAGENTLQFVFNNDPDAGGNGAGYTGLRVEMVGTASEVPIPAAAWLFGSALMGLVSLKRKKTA